MDLYILDSFYRRNQLVDRFKSLVWAERFNDFGDFELYVYSTIENRARFKINTFLGILESYGVMIVETVEDTVDEDGTAYLKVTGRSLESILLNRMAIPQHGSTTTYPNWTITDVPVAIAKKLFHDICVTGALNAKDIIPGVVEGSFLPVDNITEPADTITYVVEPQTLYEAIKTLVDRYDLGFRLIRNGDTSQVYFDIYPGSDRTSQQTSLPAVVFAPELDNLQSPTELRSIANHKNIAMVISPAGSLLVGAVGWDPTNYSGFSWRVLLVKSDVDEPWVTAEAKLQKAGRDELVKYNEVWAFDGEIDPRTSYRPNTDYYLGDLVTIRNKDGLTNDMRVTEIIYSSDETGDKAYPTLSLSKFITPGSWGAWDYGVEWDDMGETEYWATQP